MRPLECTSELLLRQRRSVCTAAELDEVQRHLASCPACRQDEQLGVDFEQAGALEPGDDARIKRYAELAAAAARGRGSVQRFPSRLRRPSRPLLLVGAALALFGAGAAAARLWLPEPTPAPTPIARLAQPGQKAPHDPLPTLPNAERPTAAPRGAGLDPAPAEARAATTGAAAPSHARAPAPMGAIPESAATLFESANAARRAGDARRAVSQYRDLQRNFPGSAEAHLSHVSQGRLLLEAGSAQAALAQFEGYLSAPAGGLRLEALAGRAQALALLGRSRDEKAALADLVREFPGSVHATRARKRLAALP